MICINNNAASHRVNSSQKEAGLGPPDRDTSNVISLAARGYPTKLPVADLTPGELFPLSVLRLWAAPHRDPNGTHADWREPFSLADLDHDTVADFDGFMRIVLATAARSLDIRCAHCPRLGMDEATFLLVVGSLQRMRPLRASTLLGQWMPATAARIALRYAGAFARAAADAGLWIPSARMGQGRVERVGVDAGLARIH